MSSIDPYSFTFRLIGEEYLNSKIIQDVKRYEWGDVILTMYLALDDRMEYLAGPNALKSTHLHLPETSLDYFGRYFMNVGVESYHRNPFQ
jgi:hypothetical protein